MHALDSSAQLAKSFLLLLTISLGCHQAFGQEAARPDRGAMPNRSYSVSDIENINLQNGNVSLSIPLAALPPIAGGKLSWTVSANYNSKIWDVPRTQEEQPDLQWAPYVVDTPAAGGGWTIGGQYRIYFRNSQEDFARVSYNDNSGLPLWEQELINNHTWWKVVLFMPDGSEHEFRPIDYGSYWGSQDFLRGFFNVIPSGSPMRYYSVDGTYMFASISSMTDWTVYMPDGTQIIRTSNGIQRIQDTNGNKIKVFTDGDVTHYQDEQTGREIRVSYDASANSGAGQYRVWYPIVGGGEQYIDVNMGTTTVQGKTYLVNDWDQGGEIVCQRFNVLSAQLEVAREIIFPQTEPGQQRKFVFSYNSDTTESATSVVNWTCNGGSENYSRQASVGWGELSRMIMPPGTTETSAYADYSYRLNSEHSLPFSTDDLAYQSIAQKKLYHDGTYDTWGYDIFDNISSFTGPDGNWLNELRYCSKYGQPNCSTDKAGLAFRTTRPFMMTERHWINLLFSGGEISSPGGVISFNPVVDFEYTTLLDANNNALKMSAKAFQYDYNGNVTQTTEYDWFDPNLVSRDGQGVPMGVPGSATVLRVTNSSHYNQASGSTSGNVYAKRSIPGATPLILNALRETTVGPSIVQLSYDGQLFDVAPTVGNLTTKKAWNDLDSQWITTSSTYDSYGNVITASDGRGNPTTFGYANPALGLPTSVTIDPENGTGTQTTYTAYDYSTGLVTSTTDANNQTSNIHYTNQLLGSVDPFGRPGMVEGPLVNVNEINQRRRTKTFYEDHLRRVTTASDLHAQDDQLLKSRTTSDMLGRPTLTEQAEDGTNYTIFSYKAYDTANRVTFSSGPMRSAPSSTDSWTRVTNDIAGRVTEIATFGGASQPVLSGTQGVFTGRVLTSYDANTVTVTDQAGKQRRSASDALGRLTQVYEAPNDSNYNYLTSYDYDVLGNLRHVYQGTQTRTFTYDSLSRLRTAMNPESGTITYAYDENGNLTSKTDARLITTTYGYDALNRVIIGDYSDSTPDVSYVYDSASVGNGKGRLASVSSSVSTYSYSGYDAMGRVLNATQTIGSQSYAISNITYDLAGHLKTMMYPSGRSVTNTFDNAGRLQSVTGTLGDNNPRNYSTGISYTASGAMRQEQFGTTIPIYNKMFYNSRGQLAEMRAGLTPNDTSWQRGAIINFYDTCWGMCWNPATQTGDSMPVNNGNLRVQQISIPNDDNPGYENRGTDFLQFFEYDPLNRLKFSNQGNWREEYEYDRYGNRTVNTNPQNTYNLPNITGFEVETATNRLQAPGQLGWLESSQSMRYDAAGNLWKDYLHRRQRRAAGRTTL